MSGFYIPRWLDLILTAGDKAHKAVHPSRWGEGKPCECGKLTRGDCSRKYGPDCVLQLPTGNTPPPDGIGPYPPSTS